MTTERRTMTELQTRDDHDLHDTSTWVASVNLISHATVRAAVSQLQHDHPMLNSDRALHALCRVAHRNGVKLRHLSAAVVNGDAGSPKASPAPALSFSLRGRGEAPRPAEVLADLLTTAVELTSADGGLVQLKDALHGGLCIESHTGLDDGYRHHFSYIDDGSTAAGRATSLCEITRVDDVTVSPLHTFADQAALAASGVRAELAVPMCDEDSRNRGAVTVIFGERHPHIDPFAVEMLHGHADSCAQWLRWYDAVVMPALVTAVHDAAAALAGASEAATA